MSDFSISYNKSMSCEGLYSNDPRDLGGETWRGISRKYHPDWNGWKVIDTIKASVRAVDLVKFLRMDDELEEMVQEFYKSEYWDKKAIGQIDDQEIADEVFDTSINQGSTIAIKYLQESLNMLNNNEKHYSDIDVDGQIGPATIKAYKAYMLTAVFPGRSKDRNIKTLLKSLNGKQFQRYAEICERKPEQEAYFYGWLNRI